MKVRKSSLRVLKQKLGEKSAVKYETAIYNMCVKIAKRDGEDIEEVYVNVAYDKLGQILTSDALGRSKILNDLKNTVEDWDSYVYFDHQAEYNREIDRSILKVVSVKGVYTCKVKGCRSDEFYMWTAQTKSCDEGSSQFRQCAICGKRKKE